MTTLQLSAETKEVSLSPNILNKQDFSKTINDEFNKILQDVNNSHNSYEKRLEKLREQNTSNNAVYNNSNTYQQENSSYELRKWENNQDNTNPDKDRYNNKPEQNSATNEQLTSAQTNSSQKQENFSNVDDKKEYYQEKSENNSQKNTSNTETNKKEVHNMPIDARAQLVMDTSINKTATQSKNEYSKGTKETNNRYNLNRTQNLSPELQRAYQNNISQIRVNRTDNTVSQAANNRNGEKLNPNQTVNNHKESNNRNNNIQNNNVNNKFSLKNNEQQRLNVNQNNKPTPDIIVKEQENQPTAKTSTLNYGRSTTKGGNNTLPNDSSVKNQSQQQTKTLNPNNLSEILKENNPNRNRIEHKDIEKISVTTTQKQDIQQISSNKPGIEENKNLTEKAVTKNGINTNIKTQAPKSERQNNFAESNLNTKSEHRSEEQPAVKVTNTQFSDLIDTNYNKPSNINPAEIRSPRQILNNSIVDQVIKKASMELSNNNSRVTISLTPENLGKVEINLVSTNGVLTAQITAENKHVQQALDKGLQDLKQNLTDQGINVDKLVVNVQNSDSLNNNFNNQQDNNFQNLNYNHDQSDSLGNNSHLSDQTQNNGETNSKYDSEEKELEEETDQNTALNDQQPAIAHGRVDYRI